MESINEVEWSCDIQNCPPRDRSADLYSVDDVIMDAIKKARRRFPLATEAFTVATMYSAHISRSLSRALVLKVDTQIAYIQVRRILQLV